MSYGTLSLEQSGNLRPFLKKARVYDLGAGDLRLSRTLLHLGARHVFAVEKEADCRPALKEITYLHTTFRDFIDPAPLVFVSWPPNWETGLRPIMEKAETVIYLGKNTDGISCGDASIWKHLMTREVLLHRPEPQNTLIVYGPKRVERAQLCEERVALDQTRI